MVEQIRCIGRDPALWRETFAQARAQADGPRGGAGGGTRGLERDLGGWHDEVRTLRRGGGPGGRRPRRGPAGRPAGAAPRCRASGRGRSTSEIAGPRPRADRTRTRSDAALSAFDPVWEIAAPREQARIVHLLVERVDYDGAAHKVSITFHPAGIQALADEIAGRPEGEDRMTRPMTITVRRAFQPARPQGPAATGGGTPPPAACDPGRVPRVARLMALALRFDEQVRTRRAGELQPNWPAWATSPAPASARS